VILLEAPRRRKDAAFERRDGTVVGADRVAKERAPKPLVQSIDEDATRAAAAYGGVSAPAAKGAVQSEVWKNRDKKWIKLDGEGAQETAKSSR